MADDEIRSTLRRIEGPRERPDLVVRVDPHSMVLLNGLITGELHIELGDVGFPAAPWNDFVVVVLAWWCEALSAPPPFKLRFMDGPYEAKLSRGSGDALDAVLARMNPSGPKLVARAVISESRFRESLISAAVATSTVCAQRGWANADTNALDTRIRDLNASHA